MAGAGGLPGAAPDDVLADVLADVTGDGRAPVGSRGQVGFDGPQDVGRLTRHLPGGGSALRL